MLVKSDAQTVRGLISGAPIYAEYVGGLGDAILRMYFSGDAWYGPMERLGDRDYAVVVLMCHNPYLAEVFQWHPNYHRIHVIDLGFTTPFHPWENPGWRFDHGLPKEAPCPPYMPADTLKFFPSPADGEMLSRLRSLDRFVLMAATAGTPDKTIPRPFRENIARTAADMEVPLVVVGRSHYLKREGREREIEETKGVIDATDRLSVPGMLEAVKLAAGVISADTSVLHAAWHEHKPVFLLYNRWCKENLVSRGPVGYMQGINRPNCDHMEFSEYGFGRLLKWLREWAK
jgi:hypothetical protein